MKKIWKILRKGQVFDKVCFKTYKTGSIFVDRPIVDTRILKIAKNFDKYQGDS